MKYPKTFIAMLALSGASLAMAQTISAPPKPDGSVRSRAPYPSVRDDVRPADGKAVDAPAPAATQPTESLPAPAVAVLGPAPDATAASNAVAATAPAPSDASLSMTGRVGVATTLESSRIVPSIRATSHASRDQVLADIDTRLTASEKSLKAMRGTTSEMSASGQAQFKAADETLKEREKALRSSLRAARNASASEWDAARSQLASDYEAYSTALGSIDTAAGIPSVR